MSGVDNAAMGHNRNEQGVVFSWMLQIVLVIVIVGIVLFDAGSIAWNYFGVDSKADDIALELSTMVESSKTTGEIEAEAKRLSKEAGGRYVKGSLVITDDQVTVAFKREATTLVVTRVGPISDWGKAEATGSAPTS